MLLGVIDSISNAQSTYLKTGNLTSSVKRKPRKSHAQKIKQADCWKEKKKKVQNGVNYATKYAQLVPKNMETEKKNRNRKKEKNQSRQAPLASFLLALLSLYSLSMAKVVRFWDMVPV